MSGWRHPSGVLNLLLQSGLGSRVHCAATTLDHLPASPQGFSFVCLGASFHCWSSHYFDMTYPLSRFMLLLWLSTASNQVYNFQSLPAPLLLEEPGVFNPWDFLWFQWVTQCASSSLALTGTSREKKLKSKSFSQFICFSSSKVFFKTHLLSPLSVSPFLFTYPLKPTLLSCN